MTRQNAITILSQYRTNTKPIIDHIVTNLYFGQNDANFWSVFGLFLVRYWDKNHASKHLIDCFIA